MPRSRSAIFVSTIIGHALAFACNLYPSQITEAKQPHLNSAISDDEFLRSFNVQKLAKSHSSTPAPLSGPQQKRNALLQALQAAETNSLPTAISEFAQAIEQNAEVKTALSDRRKAQIAVSCRLLFQWAATIESALKSNDKQGLERFIPKVDELLKHLDTLLPLPDSTWDTPSPSLARNPQ